MLCHQFSQNIVESKNKIQMGTESFIGNALQIYRTLNGVPLLDTPDYVQLLKSPRK